MSSCDVILNRNSQIAIREETTEGTAVQLSAAYANMLVYEPSITFEFDRFERAPARGTLSKLPSITGKKLATISWYTELKGSGAASTLPSWDVALTSAGFQRSTVSSIDIGAVTDEFEPGETITGGTSLATGRVVDEGTNGDSELFFVALTGTFQSAEVITGGTSGSTATSSSTVNASQGYEWRPNSVCPASATVAMVMDGLKHNIKGARGTVSITGTVGEVARLNFSYQGVYVDTNDMLRFGIGSIATGPYVIGEVVTGGTSSATGIAMEAAADGDASILIEVTSGTFESGETLTGAGGAVATSSDAGTNGLFVPDYEDTIPPAFLDVGASVHDYEACFANVTLDMANSLVARECANDAGGALAVFIGDRDPNGSMDPEMVLVGTEDFFGDLSNNATGRIYFKVGDTTGNFVSAAAPLVEYTNITGGDRGGIATANLTFGLRSATVDTTDDEILIAHL